MNEQPQICINSDDINDSSFRKYDQISKQYVDKVSEKISSQINNGEIEIKEVNVRTSGNINRISKSIKQKNTQLNKQLILLNMSLKKNITSSNRSKAKIASARSSASFRSSQDVSSSDIFDYNHKKYQASKRLRELKKMKQELHHKKITMELQKRQKQLISQRLKTQAQANEIIKMKQQRQQKVKNRIKQLEQKRKQRMEIIKKSIARSSPHLPLYKKMQKQYEEKHLQTQMIDRMKKNEQSLQKFKSSSFESIKKHEAEYMKRVKEQFHRNFNKERSKTQGVQSRINNASDIKQSRFRFRGEDPEVIEEKKNKLLKMKEFQEKSKNIKIRTNIDKYLQMEIMRDKSKNPFKYHFLKNKKYSEKEIFKGFADFQLLGDHKELGKKYMRDINKKNAEKNRSNPSSRVLATQPRVPAPKNYLEENKKMAMKNKKRDSVQELLKMFNNKSQAIEFMQQKAQMHNAKALQKIMQLQKKDGYQESLDTQKEIDNEFLSSVKSKLRCLQIK